MIAILLRERSGWSLEREEEDRDREYLAMVINGPEGLQKAIAAHDRYMLCRVVIENILSIVQKYLLLFFLCLVFSIR